MVAWLRRVQTDFEALHVRVKEVGISMIAIIYIRGCRI